MLFWLFMAFHAFRRRSDKRISLGHVGARQVPGLWHEGLQEDKAAGGLIVRSNLYLVALHARDLNMPPIQGKVGELVIESHHAVLSIVAEQTGFTMALDMLLHETGVVIGMAGCTGSIPGSKIIRRIVAVFT